MTDAHRRGERFDLNLLPALEVLLRTGSVTDSAEQLGMTQSGASRTLARLRDLFGDPLLVREGPNMRLTARAEALRPTLSRLIEDAHRLVESGGEFDPQTARGMLRMTTADYGLHVLLPGLLQRVTEEAPHLDLEVVPSEHPVEGLVSGQLDFAINIPDGLKHPDLARTRLLEDNLVCVIRRGHPALARRFTVKRYAGLEHILVAPSGRSGGIVDEALARHGLKRRVSLLTPSFLSVPYFLHTSDRVCALPRRMANQFAERWPFVLVEPPIALPGFRIQLYWMERRRTDPIHRWFRQLAREVADEL